MYDESYVRQEEHRRLSEMKDDLKELKTEGFSDRDIFEELLCSFIETPYRWGGDKPTGSDCSGTVCRTLSLLYNTTFRVTADCLYKNYFTGKTPVPNGIRAIFFLTNSGKAVHVAGSVGSDLFLNESKREPGQKGHVRLLKEIKSMYSDLIPVIRYLPPDSVRKMKNESEKKGDLA